MRTLATVSSAEGTLAILVEPEDDSPICVINGDPVTPQEFCTVV